MTGREREALHRRVSSLVWKMKDCAVALEKAGVGSNAILKIEDTLLELHGLLADQLEPGHLGRQRYLRARAPEAGAAGR